MQRQPLRTKIAIIGLGPVGLFASLLLQHFNIDFLSIEKLSSNWMNSVSYSHWINASTKVLLKQIPNLSEEINRYQLQQKLEHYRVDRYVETLFGVQMAIKDHFQPSIEQKLKQCQLLFGQIPSHIPQSIFLKIMYNHVKSKDKLIFGEQIINIKTVYDQTDKINYHLLINQNNQKIIKAQYVILCNGSSSPLRDNIQKTIPTFKMEGQTNIMNFIDIHFYSKKLAEKIYYFKTNAMQHFIFNKKMIAILINYKVVGEGYFLLQIVNYQPFVDLLDVYQPKELIKMMFDEKVSKHANEIINDIQIVNATKSQLSTLLAISFYSKAIFLVGDCAHSPNFGNFGLNIGLQDVHELVHTILFTERNPRVNKQAIFQKYSENRWKVDLLYLKKAVENLNIYKSIIKQLGYPSTTVQIFSGSSLIQSVVSKIAEKKPQYMQKIRLKAFSVTYSSKNLQKTLLPLFFDDLDLQAQNSSIIKSTIMENNRQIKYLNLKPQIHNLYAKSWLISHDDIKRLFGDVEPSNIRFFNERENGFEYGEKLISSDGRVLIP